MVPRPLVDINMGWFRTAGGALRHLFGFRQRDDPRPRPARDLMIVRRGLSDAFYFFCHVFAKEHGLKVILDRRLRDRRRRQRATPTIDRRHVDRRRGPVKWPADGFIIVRGPRRRTDDPPD